MCGVMTHVSDTKSITAWTTALQNTPDILASAASLPKIQEIRAHFFQDLQILATTTGQLFYKAYITLPRYLKYNIIVRGAYRPWMPSLPAPFPPIDGASDPYPSCRGLWWGVTRLALPAALKYHTWVIGGGGGYPPSGSL